MNISHLTMQNGTKKKIQIQDTTFSKRNWGYKTKVNSADPTRKSKENGTDRLDNKKQNFQ